MTNEEKEAIDILQNVIADEVIGTYCIEIQKEVNCAENCKDKDCYLNTAIDKVVNLIDKLQKENEELKRENKTLSEMAFIKPMPLLYTTPAFTSTDDFISKEKIRDKIKELEKQYKEELRYGRVVLDIGHTIKILKELLEE